MLFFHIHLTLLCTYILLLQLTKSQNKNASFFLRNNSPSALELKCIEVWLISCTLFVFLALMEYFIVLFGIRYDKHWRHKKAELDFHRETNNQLAKERLSKLFSQKIIPQENHHANSLTTKHISPTEPEAPPPSSPTEKSPKVN